jgi:hypothetical protein
VLQLPWQLSMRRDCIIPPPVFIAPSHFGLLAGPPGQSPLICSGSAHLRTFQRGLSRLKRL